MRPIHFAYLIVVCDKDTNAILDVTIWSSPEWGQSRCLDNPTYVAYRVGHHMGYHEAQLALREQIANPRDRYHWLYLKMEAFEAREQPLTAATPQESERMARTMLVTAWKIYSWDCPECDNTNVISDEVRSRDKSACAWCKLNVKFEDIYGSVHSGKATTHKSVGIDLT